MKVNILTKNLTISDALHVFIAEKFGGLDRYLKNVIEPVDIKVEIGKPSKHHRSGPVFYAEANLNMGGRLLRAESFHLDLRTAVIKVKNELQAQIKKFKEKKRESRKVS